MPADRWGATLLVKVEGVDVSCDVVSVDIDRGRQRLWDPMNAATCSLVVNCGKTGQPPWRGPIYSSVTVDVSYSVINRRIFTGTVQLRQLEATPQSDLLYLDAVDGMEGLSRVERVAATTDVAVGAGETIGARISRWLDEADWTAPRSLATDTDTCPATLITGNALSEIKRTALSDGGDFYIDGDGTATFKSWAWRNTVMTPVCVFSDRKAFDWVPYSGASLRDDLDEIQNYVQGERRKLGSTDVPVPQLAFNTSSVSTYQKRGDALRDLELEDDGMVENRVAKVIQAAAQSSPRFDPVVVQPGAFPSRSWPKVLSVIWGSLVAVNRTWPDGSTAAYYGHVIGERWRLTANDATITYRLSGTGTWDSFGVPRPPINVIIDPVTGCLCIPPGYPKATGETMTIRDADGTVLFTGDPADLCYCGSCGPGCITPPEGATEICFTQGDVTVCIPIDDPRKKAVLWFDVLDPGGDMLEFVEGKPVDPGPGFDGTRLGVIPGGFHAIDANTSGGLVGVPTGISDHLAAANLGSGWTVQFWLYITSHLPAATEVRVVDLGSIHVDLTTFYETTGPFITQLAVYVIEADGTIQETGPLTDVLTGAWHHYVVKWDGSVITLTVDGVLV